MAPTDSILSSFNDHPLLDRVLKLKINDAVIETLIQYLCNVVKVIEPEAGSIPAPRQHAAGKKSLTEPDNVADTEDLTPLEDFIENIVVRSRSTMSTLIVVFIYLERLKKVIHAKHSPGKPCSRHRVVFAGIMIAHKVWNDSSMVGKHWAEVSNMFNSKEVLSMEREMLELLNWNLNVTTDDVWWAARRFMNVRFIKLLEAEANMIGIYVGDLQQKPSLSAIQQPEDVFEPCALSQHPVYHANLFNAYSSFQPPQTPTGFFPLTQFAPSVTSSPAYSSSDSSCPSFYSPLLQPHPISGSSFLNPANLLAQPALPTRSSLVSRATMPMRTGPTTSTAMHGVRQLTAPFVRSMSTLPIVRISGRSKHILPGTTYPYPLLGPSARLKKKKHLSSVQLIQFPSCVHPFSALRLHTDSPSQYTGSSSGASTSITSSPTNFAGSACPQSPLLWHSRSQLRYHKYQSTSVNGEGVTTVSPADLTRTTVHEEVATVGRVLFSGSRVG